MGTLSCSGGVAYIDLAQKIAEAQEFGSYGEWISTLKKEVDVALSKLKPEEEKSGHPSEQQNQKRPKGVILKCHLRIMGRVSTDNSGKASFAPPHMSSLS